jgi:hypothetical protein
MDYYQGANINMGDASISATTAARAYMVSKGLNSYLGMTLMIGVNDDNSVFTLADTVRCTTWATQQNYVAMMSYWESARDTPVWGPLFTSSQVWQPNKYSFLQAIMKYANTATPVVIPNTIASWMTCPATDSKCADAAYTCCFGSAADLAAGKKTCRPGNNCYTTPVPTTTATTQALVATKSASAAETKTAGATVYSDTICGAGVSSCNSGLCCSQVSHIPVNQSMAIVAPALLIAELVVRQALVAVLVLQTQFLWQSTFQMALLVEPVRALALLLIAVLK